MAKCFSRLVVSNWRSSLKLFPKLFGFKSIMGCMHSKCCRKYPSSSIGDEKEQDMDLKPAHNLPVFSTSSLDFVDVPSHNFNLSYCVLSQRGHYPEALNKANQDTYCIKTALQCNRNVHFFGVFDGHGVTGTQCSNFTKDKLLEILENDSALLDDPVKAYSSAFVATNDELHKNNDIDDSISGTTAITALIIGDMLYVANVHDGDRVVAQDLSFEQTPFREDEFERVKACGARVLSVNQVEGIKDPSIQSWGNEETEGSDPPRLWYPNAMYPGTAFTRSVGDSLAKSIGVIADPEVLDGPSNWPNGPPSDGIFEFLSSQTVVDMVNKYSDPRDACSAIAEELYKLWMQNENRTDDLTIILVHIKHGSGA